MSSTCTGGSHEKDSSGRCEKRRPESVSLSVLLMPETQRVCGPHCCSFVVVVAVLFQFGEAERVDFPGRHVLHPGDSSSQVRPSARIDAGSIPRDGRLVCFCFLLSFSSFRQDVCVLLDKVMVVVVVMVMTTSKFLFTSSYL